MSTAEKVREAANVSELELRREIIEHGSSWAALVLAVKLRPLDCAELVKRVRIKTLSPKKREVAFNACVDGYAVFDDARLRDAL